MKVLKRILLVNLPFYRLLGSRYNANSLGLAYTAAVIKSLGHEVAIYNADFSNDECGDLQTIFDSGLKYHEYFEDPDHPIWIETVSKILEYQPDVVGYSCYTANMPTVKIISKHIAKVNKDVKQIAGGPHLRALSSNLSISGCIEDMFGRVNAFVGESERQFLGLKDIDEFPFPERENFWGVTEEEKKNIDLSYIITSRGCPYKCTFCASPNIWGKRVSFRSPESVHLEMIEMKEKHKINDFYILDDTFNLRPKRVKEILNNIKKLNVTWRCNVRLDRLDDEICELMKASGCVEAKAGVESGSNRILKLAKKGETKEDMKKGLQLLKKYDIPITAYMLAGFPDETDADLRKTIEFAKEIQADRYSLSILSPYYGSELYFQSERDGTISEEAYQYFYHQYPKPLLNDKISDKMIKEYFELGKLNNV